MITSGMKKDVTGWHIDAAIGYLIESNTPYRITYDSGQSYVITDDLIPERVNLHLVASKVISVTYG